MWTHGKVRLRDCLRLSQSTTFLELLSSAAILHLGTCHWNKCYTHVKLNNAVTVWLLCSDLNSRGNRREYKGQKSAAQSRIAYIGAITHMCDHMITKTSVWASWCSKSCREGAYTHTQVLACGFWLWRIQLKGTAWGVQFQDWMQVMTANGIDEEAQNGQPIV